ncbi:MAG: hypothetical protein JWM56_105 [Candidatus Peribacteria bacterium]|nr:hypothetical protein [Candidatus Peribacteria bacterium]
MVEKLPSYSYYPSDAAEIINASKDLPHRKKIVEQLTAAVIQNGLQPSSLEEEQNMREQVNAWDSSIVGLGKAFEHAELTEDQKVLLEVILNGRRRIDAVICGMNAAGQPSAVVTEGKGWHNRRKGKNKKKFAYRYDQIPSHDTSKLLLVFSENALVDGELPSWRVVEKPHRQVWNYTAEVRTKVRELSEDDLLAITPALYFTETDRIPKRWDTVMKADLQSDMRRIPVFTKGSKKNETMYKDISEYLQMHVGHGAGNEALRILDDALSLSAVAPQSDPIMRELFYGAELSEIDEQRYRNYCDLLNLRTRYILKD